MNRSGFTLIEVSLAAAASLLLLAAATATCLVQVRFLRSHTAALEAHEAGRRVLTAIAREIRVAGFAPVADGPFVGADEGIGAAGREAIELRSDFHGASSESPPEGISAEDSDEWIGFFLSPSGSGVSQSVGRQVLPLVDGARVAPSGLKFRYDDGCGGELIPDPVAGLSAEARRRVRVVRISLAVIDSAGRPAFRGELAARLRNRSLSSCEDV